MNGNGCGYCGIDCPQCPIFIATKTHDDALRRKTASAWSDMYKDFLGKVLSAEDMVCAGCKSSGETLFIGCQTCQIRECCSKKGLAACKACEKYRDCETIQGFLAFHHLAP